jgi:putative membrane protein
MASDIPRNQVFMLGALLALLVLAQVDQPYPSVAPLHHIPTLILLLASPVILRRWPMSNHAVACIVLFFVLHTIGGRYTYTTVPYEQWTRSLFGTGINEILGLERNHFDRLVHFSYGLLAVFPTREFLERHLKISPSLALYIAVESVIAVSAIYELFEWFLSIVLAGPLAADYNGQQGDMWDAQKDMGLAAVGALISAVVLRLRAVRPNIAEGSPGSAASG